MDGNMIALDKYLDEQDAYEKSLKKCDNCNEVMQFEYYDIDGEHLCEECANDYLKECRREV